MSPSGPAAVYIGLLRAVNLGSHGKVSMTGLRSWCEDLGVGDVATYIQSGNAVFTYPGRSEAKVKAAVEAEIAAVTGKPVPTMLRSAAQLAVVVDANPYEPEQPTHLHVVFFDEKLPRDAYAAIDLEAFEP